MSKSKETDNKPFKVGSPTSTLNLNASGSKSSSRLPSFRGPRDLTLSLSAKNPIKPVNRSRKNFAPNIPIKRERGEKTIEIKVEKPIRKRNEKPRGGGRGRGRGKERQFIQTHGTLFGEGVAAAPIKRGPGSYFGGGGAGGGLGKQADSLLHKPVLNPGAAFNVDNDLEKRRLEELLRDDFIDDPDQVTPELLPVILPLSSSRKVFKEDKEDEKFSFKNDNICADISDDLASRVKVKREPPDESDMCDSLKELKVPMEEDSKINANVPERTVHDILKQPGNLIFIKFPSTLPGHYPDIKEESGGQNGSKQPSQDAQKRDENVTLDTLPEGRIGTFRLYKSGKTDLILGDHKLLVDKGIPMTALHDLVSIKTDAEQRTGDLIVLGHIKDKLAIAPDFEDMVKRKKKL